MVCKAKKNIMTEEGLQDRRLPTHRQGRFAAGQDPLKRGQIVEGAKRVFMRLGFDAASINEVCREAGVSKGTIYVYFENKEDLLGAIVELEIQRFAFELKAILADSEKVEDWLYRFGMDFATHITSPQTINVMRTLIGVNTRMPKLCSRYFHSLANARSVIEDFIKRHVALGDLSVEDTALAACHFIELVSGTFVKARLIGDLDDVPSRDELDHVVHSAIRVFMAAYGSSRKASNSAQPRRRAIIASPGYATAFAVLKESFE
jgi:AcrR family transcriptional regulator